MVSFGKILRSAMVAGILAGVVAAVYHFLVTQPLIDQAVAYASVRGSLLEEDQSATASGAGLLIGLLMYAATWALFFGIAFAALQRILPTMAPWKRGAYLAVLIFWAFGALPFLKYPASPPGIGDDVTLNHRAALYLASLILIVMGSAVSIVFTRLVELRIGPGLLSFGGGLAVLTIYSALVIFLLPGVPDPAGTPLDLVDPFRAASLGGLTLYWGLLAAGFALQLRGYAAPPPPTVMLGSSAAHA